MLSTDRMGIRKTNPI